MKQELCKTFAQDLEFAPVPAGLAVGTDFQKSDGDHIAFYIIGPDEAGQYRVQDDGATAPYLEACGCDAGLESVDAIQKILREYGVTLDEKTLEITSEPMDQGAIPGAGLRLVAALLRLQDIATTPCERKGSRLMQEPKRDLAHPAVGIG